MEYYSSLKKKDILPFATRWMNVEAIMPTEISQTQKDTKCMIDLGASLSNPVFGEQKPQSTEINLLEALYLLSKVLG